MKVVRNLSSLKKYRSSSKGTHGTNGTVGFVPTMGALHEGHLALARKSLAQCDCTIVSIFVNPTQFNNAEDFAKYPQTLDQDLKLLKSIGVNAVFLPTREIIYPDNFRFRVTEGEESNVLDGAHRPGHFSGVLTIVLKLLNLVRPDRAYFGEKDFQQLKLIRDMVAAFFLECKIVPVKTVRAKSGLALSSRNTRLSETGLTRAAQLSRLISDRSLTPAKISRILADAGFKTDYVEDRWNRRFVAAHVEGVRLIDNVAL